ncbi:MAG: PEP-CTERM sorting domain-containing protein [Azonexaceae bacterium]|nr:PEP-CTERM sorting domain-containing protein [Azonexaceae bacterium]
MKKITVLAATLVSAAISQSAYALPALVGGENEIFFKAVENWVDKDQNGVISQGDYFYGIINAQNIDANGGTNWYGSATDQLSGYFLQEVASVTATTTANIYNIQLGAFTGGSDPFGVLTAADIASGAQLKLFTDSTTPFVTNTGVVNDITKATDGTLWGTLGNTSASNYWYSLGIINPNIVFAAGLANTVGNTLAGLDFITNNTGKVFVDVNDPSENLFDTQVALYANAEIVDKYGPTSNPDAIGPSAWRFQVNDPAVVNAIPEPGSLALLGLSLLGFIGVQRRKSSV